MYTARLEIRYRNNVPIGQPLKIIGRAGKNRCRMVESWARTCGPDDSLIGETKALYVDRPNFPEPAFIEESGWKAYPDEKGL